MLTTQSNKEFICSTFLFLLCCEYLQCISLFVWVVSICITCVVKLRKLLICRCFFLFAVRWALSATVYFWWNLRTFWPCIDSNATDKIKAQKGSKHIVKIVHVTSVVKLQFYEATKINKLLNKVIIFVIFIKNILICVPKMNECLTCLEQHEGE